MERGGKMARLHKVSMFVLDVNECYESVSDLIEHAFDRTEASAHFIESKTAEFPWYDDIILNSGNSTKQDYEDFMDETTRREKEIRTMLDSKFDELKKSIKGILSSAGITDTDKNVLEFMKQMRVETEYRIEDDNPNGDYGDFIMVGTAEQGGYKCPKCGHVNNAYVDGKTCPKCGYGKKKR